MTVVIMALGWDGVAGRPNGVVGVCDHLLSNDTAKVTLKYSKLADLSSSWILGFADNPGYFFPIVRRAVYADPPFSSLSADGVIQRVKEAYRDVRKLEIESKILSSYGLNLESFLKNGLAIFGRERFDTMCDRVDRFELGIELILAGWPESNLNDPRVVTISNPGAHHDHTLLGSAAIGIGAEIAQGHLDAVYSSAGSTTMVALYRCLEAKFMAEAAPSVGQDTTAIVIRPGDAHISILPPENCADFRAEWERRRAALEPSLLGRLETKSRRSIIGRRNEPALEES